MTYHRPASDRVCQILDRLACPQCRIGLAWRENFLLCDSCGTAYPIIGEIADLRPPTHKERAELVDWSKHWSDANQKALVQRFFSFYRKALFARTVRYFLDRYFPSTGVFVEAGSGTSETSMRIDKHGGARLLVAIDIVLPVLSMCHPAIDVRVCGDIFSLPFREASVDGIWNVGVMEHFTHDQFDLVMREFHRILRHGGRIILLWPATDSIPQKMLRVTEILINITRKREKFQFHPDEVSQLRSMQQGREILARNGFRSLHINYGFRSFMAFKTLVGEKDSAR